jgi:hypothetical protein
MLLPPVSSPDRAKARLSISLFAFLQARDFRLIETQTVRQMCAILPRSKCIVLVMSYIQVSWLGDRCWFVRLLCLSLSAMPNLCMQAFTSATALPSHSIMTLFLPTPLSLLPPFPPPPGHHHLPVRPPRPALGRKVLHLPRKAKGAARHAGCMRPRRRCPCACLGW